MYRVWLRPRLWAGLASTRPASSGAAEPFLSGSSGAYVEQMYEAWTQNPSSVHKARERDDEVDYGLLADFYFSIMCTCGSVYL